MDKAEQVFKPEYINLENKTKTIEVSVPLEGDWNALRNVKLKFRVVRQKRSMSYADFKIDIFCDAERLDGSPTQVKLEHLFFQTPRKLELLGIVCLALSNILRMLQSGRFRRLTFDEVKSFTAPALTDVNGYCQTAYNLIKEALQSGV